MLRPFLVDLARKPFVWGRCDCCLILADWWMAVHGVDPAADLRGAYGSEEECHALLAREGGVLRLVGRLAGSVGAVPTTEPVPGDFGVVKVAGLHIGAILAPDGKWAGKSPRGLAAYTPDKLVSIWKI